MCAIIDNIKSSSGMGRINLMGQSGGKGMPRCSRIDECAFYSGALASVPGPSAYIKDAYCHSRPEACSRLRRDRLDGVSSTDNQITPLGRCLSMPAFMLFRHGPAGDHG